MMILLVLIIQNAPCTRECWGSWGCKIGTLRIVCLGQGRFGLAAWLFRSTGVRSLENSGR